MDLIHASQEYITLCMGNKMTCDPINFTPNLPMYFSRQYKLYKCRLFNIDFLILAGKYDEDTTSKMLEKRLDMLINSRNQLMPVVFLTDQITQYMRKKLVQKNISFVIPQKQLYMPFLGIAFTESFSERKREKTALLPATQYLFFSILDSHDKSFTVHTLEKNLPISRMSIYRGLEELADKKLLRKEKDGKIVTYYQDMGKKTLWKLAQELLSTPISTRLYAIPLEVSIDSFKCFVIAGETALEKYTMVYGSNIKTYAVYGKKWGVVKKQFKILPYKDEEAIAIEVWRHKPPSIDGVLHPLALHLTLRAEMDERVQMGLEDIIDEYEWEDN